MSAHDTVPPGPGQSWRDCLDLLSLARRTRIPPVVAGFDGFVDTIVHAVSERHSASVSLSLLILRILRKGRKPILGDLWERSRD